ncbi:MAG: phosphoenolpyruvate-utilizing N-terminal domain-containing protein, partial [Candidatus Nanoarchaeia archaeon]
MPVNKERSQEFLIHGIPASPGVAIGTALVIRKAEFFIEERTIAPEDVEKELAAFAEAIDITKKQILALQNRVQNVLSQSDARIFDAHLLILDDKMIMDEVENSVRKELKGVDFIFNRTIQRFIAAISKMDDQYMRERAQDIRDVAERVIKNLHRKNYTVLDKLPGQRIIVAHEITPSDTAVIDKDNVQAFATETGGKTSHTAIMARSLQIPAVVGAQNLFLDTIHNGDLLIV